MLNSFLPITLFTVSSDSTSNFHTHTVLDFTIPLTSHIWVQPQKNTILTVNQQTTLMTLLDATVNHSPPTVAQIVVTSRMGTLSPWSSKAADIAAQCGVVGLRLELVKAYDLEAIPADKKILVMAALYDKMTQSIHTNVADSCIVLNQQVTSDDYIVPVLKDGKAAIESINIKLGLALSAEEINSLYTYFSKIQRNPTDAELMMFAQANSEHCRHKIFNSIYTVDGVLQDLSMFGHIRTTHAHTPQGTVVAYSDNSAVIGASTVERFRPDSLGKYTNKMLQAHAVLKAETHNHPTAISPYSGAATGAGGEIRDEGATGRGAQPRAGFTGFSTSLLGAKTPSHLATPTQIMLEGPLGAAAFNNEFGRPALGGYWRAYESNIRNTSWGYHKPIMLAAGWGTIDAQHATKQAVRAGDYLIQLGGPGLKIGVGGGAASSMVSGQNTVALDFNSVQRDNAEMQRRAQMVINACMALGDANPIRSIHDVGAGGLSNAFPEIVDADGLGAEISLDKIPLGETGLSALEAWCNESQERYSLAIAPEDWSRFESLCHRERCPVAHIGVATKLKQFQVKRQDNTLVVDWAMDVLLGKKDKLQRVVNAVRLPNLNFNTNINNTNNNAEIKTHTDNINNIINSINNNYDTINSDINNINNANIFLFENSLKHPTIASKRFLITIGDRTVGGYTHRDPMVGPWQEPVADCAVTLLDYSSLQAEAASMGERTPLAVFNPAASGRMAVAEALTNLAAAPVSALDSIKLSCNWMAAASQPEQDAALYATVEATATFCRDMNLGVPVGKDSLSMQVNSSEGVVTSPVSLVVTAYAPVPCISGLYICDNKNKSDSKNNIDNINNTQNNQSLNQLSVSENAVFTPFMRTEDTNSTTLMVLKANKYTRLAASMAQQINNLIDTVETPDITSTDMRNWWNAFQKIRQSDMALAYHDVSDGGLWVSLSEMAFATRCGLSINLKQASIALNTVNTTALLFNEEIAAVLQIKSDKKEAFLKIAQDHKVIAFEVGHITRSDTVNTISLYNHENELLYTQKTTYLHRLWDSVSADFTAQRDTANVVLQESQRIGRDDYTVPHLHQYLTFSTSTSSLQNKNKTVAICSPKVAILREQGINSMVEMAYAWTQAGFDAYDVTMTDLIAGRVNLADFQALVACGGFSYGDVLGAGLGWAKSILCNSTLRTQFQLFFHRPETIALGVCNGCQMMSYLDELMPNTKFPRFTHNASGRYEARVSMLEIVESPSILLKGMAGTRLPVAVAHGEGRIHQRPSNTVVAMRFVDGLGNPTELYPMNPNGSVNGEASVCSPDGRVTLMMPHPERVFRYAQWSWLPDNVNIDLPSPWMQLFHNAYSWCNEKNKQK